MLREAREMKPGSEKIQEEIREAEKKMKGVGDDSTFAISLGQRHNLTGGMREALRKVATISILGQNQMGRRYPELL